MRLHPLTFKFIKPSDEQLNIMDDMRTEAAQFAEAVERSVPDGPDKTYILREFRGLCFWINAAITRNTDGSPRETPT
jgi:hypothetical protein